MKTDLKPSPYDGTIPGANSPQGKPLPKQFRYYDLVMAAFVTILLCSNLIGAAKVCKVWGVTFGAGVLFFPVSYVFGDIFRNRIFLDPY